MTVTETPQHLYPLKEANRVRLAREIEGSGRPEDYVGRAVGRVEDRAPLIAGRVIAVRKREARAYLDGASDECEVCDGLGYV